jgi:hypothetical protein
VHPIDDCIQHALSYYCGVQSPPPGRIREFGRGNRRPSDPGGATNRTFSTAKCLSTPA